MCIRVCVCVCVREREREYLMPFVAITLSGTALYTLYLCCMDMCFPRVCELFVISISPLKEAAGVDFPAISVVDVALLVVVESALLGSNPRPVFRLSHDLFSRCSWTVMTDVRCLVGGRIGSLGVCLPRCPA